MMCGSISDFRLDVTCGLVASFAALLAFCNFESTGRAVDMSTLYLYRAGEEFSAQWTDFLWFVFFNCLEKLLTIFFLSKFGIIYAAPSLSFRLLEIFLQFPASFKVTAIMEIETAVSKGTIARIVPIFTEVEDIVESA